jgi:hypothetical protein
MLYFLGTDSDAPLSPAWDPTSPAFFVSAPRSDDLEKVRSILPHRHIIWLGSHEGCGCGFRRLHPEIPFEEQEEEAARADHAALVAYLEVLPKTERADQIFCYWDGESEPLEHSRTCKIWELLGDHFAFQEREIITLIR